MLYNHLSPPPFPYNTLDINLVFFLSFINISCFFLLMNSILLCKYTLICLQIHQLKSIQFSSPFFKPTYFKQLEANYFTTLWWFLPYIVMNQPWIYRCSPSQYPLLPPSPSHPSGSSQCTSPEHLFLHPTWAGDLFPFLCQ